MIRPFVPGGAGGAKILTDQLTLSQPGGADYSHHITNGTPGFSDLSMTLHKELGIKMTEFLRFES